VIGQWLPASGEDEVLITSLGAPFYVTVSSVGFRTGTVFFATTDCSATPYIQGGANQLILYSQVSAATIGGIGGTTAYVPNGAQVSVTLNSYLNGVTGQPVSCQSISTSTIAMPASTVDLSGFVVPFSAH
jgi:hypothetical protein